MKITGIVVILMWVSVAHLLYPFPPQLVSQYRNYVGEETELFVQTLTEQDRTEYRADSDKFLRSHMRGEEIKIWLKWCLRLILDVLGITGGWLIFANKNFHFVVAPTSGIYLFQSGHQLGVSLPVWGPPWFGAYIEFLAGGSYTGSVLYELHFYNQYLVLPILHLALLVFCLVWKKAKRREFTAE